MAERWLCCVVTSHMSVRIHVCCQLNHPLRTKHGACRRIRFRAACLSECAQTCPSDRTNHVFEIFSCSCAASLLLRRGQQLRTAGARRWARKCFDALFCRCICSHQVPRGGRRARARVVTGGARARLASRVSGSCGGNLQISFVREHTNMIDVADLSMFPLLQTPSKLRNRLRRWLCAAEAKAPVQKPDICATEGV